MCKKASQQINVLKRIGQFLNFQSRKAVYHAFIMSNSNFCPLIWHFCSQSKTEKLEKKFRASIFVFQDFNSSYEDLILEAGATTLHLSRLRTLAIETFKIAYGLSSTYLKDFICLKTHLLTISGTQIY